MLLLCCCGLLLFLKCKKKNVVKVSGDVAIIVQSADIENQYDAFTHVKQLAEPSDEFSKKFVNCAISAAMGRAAVHRKVLDDHINELVRVACSRLTQRRVAAYSSANDCIQKAMSKIIDRNAFLDAYIRKIVEEILSVMARKQVCAIFAANSVEILIRQYVDLAKTLDRRVAQSYVTEVMKKVDEFIVYRGCISEVSHKIVAELGEFAVALRLYHHNDTAVAASYEIEGADVLQGYGNSIVKDALKHAIAKREYENQNDFGELVTPIDGDVPPCTDDDLSLLLKSMQKNCVDAAGSNDTKSVEQAARRRHAQTINSEDLDLLFETDQNLCVYKGHSRKAVIYDASQIADILRQLSHIEATTHFVDSDDSQSFSGSSGTSSTLSHSTSSISDDDEVAHRGRKSSDGSANITAPIRHTAEHHALNDRGRSNRSSSGSSSNKSVYLDTAGERISSSDSDTSGALFDGSNDENSSSSGFYSVSNPSADSDSSASATT